MFVTIDVDREHLNDDARIPHSAARQDLGGRNRKLFPNRDEAQPSAQSWSAPLRTSIRINSIIALHPVIGYRCGVLASRATALRKFYVGPNES